MKQCENSRQRLCLFIHFFALLVASVSDCRASVHALCPPIFYTPLKHIFPFAFPNLIPSCPFIS